MDRRLFMIAAVGAGFYFYDRMYVPPLSEDGEKILAYVGARDCGPCRSFEANGRSQFRQAAAQRGWKWAEYSGGSLANLTRLDSWPPDRRWISEKAGGISSTPTFVLFDAGKAVRRTSGWGGVEATLNNLLG